MWYIYLLLVGGVALPGSIGDLPRSADCNKVIKNINFELKSIHLELILLDMYPAWLWWLNDLTNLNFIFYKLYYVHIIQNIGVHCCFSNTRVTTDCCLVCHKAEMVKHVFGHC